MVQEIRLAVRQLAKAPGYTAAAVTTLALAIAATTSIFSAVYAVLLNPMPVRQASSLVVGWGLDPARSQGLVELTYRDVEALGRNSRSLSGVASVGASTWTTVFDDGGDPVRLSYAGVSGTFFDTLGVAPLVGRTLRPDDDVPNGAKVIVLSHGAWVDRFGADPGIVGRTLRLDDENHEVVGVLPRGFDYPRGSDLWMPLAPMLSSVSDVWKTDVLATVGLFFLVGRLQDDATVDSAARDLSVVGRGIDAGRPSGRIGTQVVLEPFLDHVIGPARPAIWALFAATAILLLIASANVSGLMLTRVSLRHREHAIRLALGATRAAVGRQWVAETLTLALAGGALGVLLARWLTAAIVALAPDGIPRLDEVAMNPPVAVFAFAAILVTALLCGSGPVHQAGRVTLAEALSDGGRAMSGAHSMRARSLLLVGQVSLAVVLLVAAGLVMRSFAALRQVDLGFEPANVLTVQVDPRVDRPPVNEWMGELIARVATHPEIEAVGGVYLRPLALGPIGQGTWVLLPGQPDTPQARAGNPVLNYQAATPDYFRAMRIAVRRGRSFTSADGERSERVAIVGESTARRLWPGADPLGQRLLLPTFDRAEGAPDSAWRTVVGVVSDVRYRGIGEVQYDVYDPARQTPTGATDLVIRTAGDPLRLAGVVQARARDLSPRALVNGITTLDAIVARAMAPWRFSAWVFSLFAVLAFALATVGLFSLVSLDVAQRRQELAIRLALGASPGQVARRALGSSLGRAVTGLALGLIAAALSTGMLRALLFGVPWLDWPTYLAVAGLVGLVVLVASYLPVRAATTADPASLLRTL